MSSATSQRTEISIPQCEKGVGTVIRTIDAKGMIDGVRLEALKVWPDDRGYFLEVMRAQQGLASGLPAATSQVSAALSYPGTIKAFHFHRRQTDLWVPASGMLQVALVDLRPDSPTFGSKNTIFIGSLQPWRVLIPPGVGHGYKVIGETGAMLVYVTDHFYDPQDEGRIPYDDSSIQYDWTTQHK